MDWQLETLVSVALFFIIKSRSRINILFPLLLSLFPRIYCITGYPVSSLWGSRQNQPLLHLDGYSTVWGFQRGREERWGRGTGDTARRGSKVLLSHLHQLRSENVELKPLRSFAIWPQRISPEISHLSLFLVPGMHPYSLSPCRNPCRLATPKPF